MSEVQAWGVFRDDRLVSSEKGQIEKDAVEQAVALNKFNGDHARYIAQPIRGRRIRVEPPTP